MLTAVVIALLSAACYAVSAVLQQRQAARQAKGGAALALRLAGEPVWWLAVGATIIGALLHALALTLGPLSVVEPLGVMTLAFALPLAAVLTRRPVHRVEWLAAVAVMAGVAALLAVAPTTASAVTHLALERLCVQVGCVAGLVLSLLVLAWLVRGRVVAVVRAVAAATCFGTAACTARVTLTGLVALPIGVALTITAATGGFAIAQLAYREGGLGPPLATLILVDPLVGVVSGAVLLDQPLVLGAVEAAVALLGLTITAVGIWTLARHSGGTADTAATETPTTARSHS